ncbi:MAG TPA: hypothetical protein ACHBX0_08515 [Arsenophonus sp.]
MQTEGLVLSNQSLAMQKTTQDELSEEKRRCKLPSPQPQNANITIPISIIKISIAVKKKLSIYISQPIA